jgi:rsbT antagonist protein RsbS
MPADSIPRIPLRVSQGTVVASIQVDVDPDVLSQLQDDLLQAVQVSGATGVIIDLSALGILDPGDLDELRATIDMVALLGARTVLAGMRPGMISALMDLNANVDGLDAALTLDDAFDRLKELQQLKGGDPWASDDENPYY